MARKKPVRAQMQRASDKSNQVDATTGQPTTRNAFLSIPQMHLIVESPSSETPLRPAGTIQNRVGAPFESLPVPEGLSTLRTGSDGQPQLVASTPESLPDGVVIEQLLNPRQQPRLLLLNLNGTYLRVNGQPAPRVAVVKEKD